MRGSARSVLFSDPRCPLLLLIGQRTHSGDSTSVNRSLLGRPEGRKLKTGQIVDRFTIPWESVAIDPI